MKCKILLVLFLAGILSSAGEQDGGEDGGSPRHDLIKLSLIWPNTYCLTDHDCRRTVPQYFIINSLWAEMDNGEKVKNCATPYNMTDVKMDGHKVDLLKFWPDLSTYNYQNSKKTWKEKWETDGSCCSDLMQPENYLAKAMSLRQSHNMYQILTDGGVLANGSSYTTNKILGAIRKGTRTLVDIVCDTDRVGNVYLSEIHQCLDGRGKGFVDCQNIAVNCDRDPIFPDSLFTGRATQAARKAARNASLA
ncbi:hypothetical protein L6164_005681 [Bauhinia variegata]|uniref:Uncharacterized protein n=1 Tax=Bauhinia variegata TaxID=167791 RepID=A0ACB9PXF1_BAUVA|nr:hypothetical protein L6164_005681 [Bauhinia variegata]